MSEKPGDRAIVGYELKTVHGAGNFECSICHHLLREAMGAQCSHLFCRGCIRQALDIEDDKNGTSQCPKCGKTIDEDKIYPNAYVDRLVKGSNVYCSQKDEGCAWTGTVKSFSEEHKGTCIYQIVQCSNEGCKHSEMKRKIKDHESECQYRIIECQYCQAPIKPVNVEVHHLCCEEKPTACPQNECGKIVLRKEMQEHLEKGCQFAFINCSYSEFGCQEKVQRKDLDQHIGNSTKQHVEFMYNYLSQSHTMIQDITNHLKTSNDHINKLRSEIDHLQEVNQEIKLFTPYGKTSFTYELIKLLATGVERWVKKTDDDFYGRETYAAWHDQVSALMRDQELYKFSDFMFIKMKIETWDGIYWSSNSTEKQEKVLKAENINEKAENHVLIRNVDNCLVLDTQTYGYFHYKNSKAFALHQLDKDKIAEFEHFRCDINSFSSWHCPKLSDDFNAGKHVIICVVNTLFMKKPRHNPFFPRSDYDYYDRYYDGYY